MQRVIALLLALLLCFGALVTGSAEATYDYCYDWEIPKTGIVACSTSAFDMCYAEEVYFDIADEVFTKYYNILDGIPVFICGNATGAVLIVYVDNRIEEFMKFALVDYDGNIVGIISSKEISFDEGLYQLYFDYVQPKYGWYVILAVGEPEECLDQD